MKKLIFILFLFTFLISCTKEGQIFSKYGKLQVTNNESYSCWFSIDFVGAATFHINNTSTIIDVKTGEHTLCVYGNLVDVNTNNYILIKKFTIAKNKTTNINYP